MGLSTFSMSPAFVPTIKDLAQHVTRAQARTILQHVLGLKTTAHVMRYMAKQIAEIAPNLEILDTA